MEFSLLSVVRGPWSVVKDRTSRDRDGAIRPAGDDGDCGDGVLAQRCSLRPVIVRHTRRLPPREQRMIIEHSSGSRMLIASYRARAPLGARDVDGGSGRRGGGIPRGLPMRVRVRLLLLAVACVVGGASEDAVDRFGQESTAELAEDKGGDNWSDASANGARAFTETPGGEPIALLKGRGVMLKPSRLAFRIPQAWLEHYDSPPKYPFPNLREKVTDPEELDRHYAAKDNLHFTHQELAGMKSGKGNEWDVTFAKVVNDILPFEQCVFHGGGEGWGVQGHSFADLQMRIYVGKWDATAIQKLVKERAFPTAQKLTQSAFTPGASLEHSTHGGWRIETLTFAMRFFDYGATAIIDFYVRKNDRSTVVLVFMYTAFPRNQKAELQDIVGSFRVTKAQEVSRERP